MEKVDRDIERQWASFDGRLLMLGLWQHRARPAAFAAAPYRDRPGTDLDYEPGKRVGSHGRRSGRDL
jgi:hypothetical protein